MSSSVMSKEEVLNGKMGSPSSMKETLKLKEEKSEEERQKLRHGTISWEGEERRKEGERERGGREEMATDPTGKWMIGGSGRLSTVMEILQGVKVVGEERARVTVLST